MPLTLSDYRRSKLGIGWETVQLGACWYKLIMRHPTKRCASVCMCVHMCVCVYVISFKDYLIGYVETEENPCQC